MIRYLWATYAVLNLFVLLLYLYDKFRSKRRKGRVPESTLLLAAAVGPFGAFAGMKMFRHKVRKKKFLLVPLLMAAHLVIIAYLIF